MQNVFRTKVKLEGNSGDRKTDKLVATGKPNFISDDGIGWTATE